MALGALATAATFVLVLINQKGTQKQIDSLSHGMYGIVVSDGAEIGKNAVIFQQVTIGSNTLADSRKQGSPVIGDNVYIGSGAKIIGNIRIGNNVRIGANCIVVEDIEDNSVVVMNKPRIIKKTHSQNNTFITRGELKSQDRHDNH